MPNIYKFIDYRKFLLEFITHKKLKNHRFSCRQLATQLGTSPATFVRILNGKRNLSKKMLPKFIAYFKLRERASEYFGLMVELAHVKGADKKNAVYRKLLAFRNERIKTIRPLHYSLFETWYLAALREIIDIRGTIGSAKSLAAMVQPPITPRQATRAVDTLRGMKVISEGKRGRSSASDKFLSTGEKWESVAIGDFQVQMARLAEEALLHVPKDERDFSTLTLGLSEADFYQVKEILKKARQEILAVAEDSAKRERVYEINMQLFPISTKLSKDTKK